MLVPVPGFPQLPQFIPDASNQLQSLRIGCVVNPVRVVLLPHPLSGPSAQQEVAPSNAVLLADQLAVPHGELEGIQVIGSVQEAFGAFQHYQHQRKFGLQCFCPGAKLPNELLSPVKACWTGAVVEVVSGFHSLQTSGASLVIFVIVSNDAGAHWKQPMKHLDHRDLMGGVVNS